MNTQLIFVEGLPGLGKTTTSIWLAQRLLASGIPARLYLETQPGHPINVGGDLHPAGSESGAALFKRYTPESYQRESLEKWQAFVEAAQPEETVSVLDSYPFQNSARVLMQMDADPALIGEYTQKVETIVQPLQPRLVYLAHPSAEAARRHFEAIGKQRGVEWMQYVAELIALCPYAQARGLQGEQGVFAFMSAYHLLVEQLLLASRLPRLVLENCAGRWEACYAQIEAFLGLS